MWVADGCVSTLASERTGAVEAVPAAPAEWRVTRFNAPVAVPSDDIRFSSLV